MQFMTLLSTLALAASALSAPSAVVSRAKLDVFVPEITAPQEGDSWVIGEKYQVTWNTDDAPVNITNKLGNVKLRANGLTLPVILADGFDITDGSVEVTAPSVDDGEYQIVLMGDSGNFSPTFKISKA